MDVQRLWINMSLTDDFVLMHLEKNLDEHPEEPISYGELVERIFVQTGKNITPGTVRNCIARLVGSGRVARGSYVVNKGYRYEVHKQ